MKKVNLGVKVLMLALASYFVTSCSSDNSDYYSICPTFSDITFVTTDGSSTLCVGDTIIATAVQSRQGNLLNTTNYTWSCDADSIGYHANTSKLIYDYDKSNPTDTIVINEAGTYELSLDIVYRVSGLYSGLSGTTKNGKFSVTYSTGSTRYQVSMSKEFTVKRAQ